MPAPPIRHTVSEVAKRLRCSNAKVLDLIRAGQLTAIDTSLSATRATFVVTEDSLRAFEREREFRASPPPTPITRNKRFQGEPTFR